MLVTYEIGGLPFLRDLNLDSLLQRWIDAGFLKKQSQCLDAVSLQCFMKDGVSHPSDSGGPVSLCKGIYLSRLTHRRYRLAVMAPSRAPTRRAHPMLARWLE